MRAVDGTRLKEYLTCPRLAYLGFHPPPDVRPPTPRMDVLFRSGRRVEARILDDLAPVAVEFPPGDFDAGCAATLAALGSGAPAIANGVLKLGEFLGRPDLLLRADDGGYEVADVKSGQQVHASALLQVAFYSRLLGQVHHAPRRGHVIVRDGSRVTFPLADYAASVEHLLERLLEFRRGGAGQDPGPHHAEACDDCRYQGHCAPELEARQDLSLVPGVTRAQTAALCAAGIAHLDALAAVEKHGPVAKGSGLSADRIRQLVRRARAVRDGAPLRIGAPRLEVAEAKLALAAVVDPRQTEPAVAIAGLVLADPARFRARFLRAREAGDPLAEIRGFLTNLVQSSGPILTFGTTVPRLLERLLDRLPGAARAVDAIRRRVVDLRAELRRAVALPGFDRTPALAARAAGLPVGDDAVDLAALRYLEEEDGTEPAAVVKLLRRDLDALAQLRDFLLAPAPRP